MTLRRPSSDSICSAKFDEDLNIDVKAACRKAGGKHRGWGRRQAVCASEIDGIDRDPYQFRIPEQL